MRTKTIAFDEDQQHVEVTVRRASFLDDLERSQMITEALEAEAQPDLSPREQAVRTATIVIWPSVMVATEQVIGLHWPMDFEEFLDLPSALVDAWMAAIWEQNPAWSTKGTAAEKKA